MVNIKRTLDPLSRIVEYAPTIELSGGAMRQTVSWSHTQDRPVSFGEFIATKAPRSRRVFSLDADAGPGSVPTVDELSESELKKVVCTRLQEGTGASSLAIMGEGVLSVNQLIDEIKVGTELGQELLAAEKRNIALLERLAEAGKLRNAEDPPQPAAAAAKVAAFEL